MENKIEILDQSRMKYLEGYLISFSICLVLILTRHFFRLDDLNAKPIGGVVLLGLILTVLLQAYFVARSASLERDIRQNPGLEAALNNELVKSMMTESWVAAYIGTSAMTVFFAISGFFYPVCDPVTIALASIAAGAGANRGYFYFRYKNA